MDTKKYSCSLGDKEIQVELNNWAEQASGSVLVRLGDTIVLATAVMGKNPKEGMDYFPLSVEYEEKFYATGKILGSRFIKRETRPSEEAVLAGRFIDRSIRPRFNSKMRNEVQVIITVLSIDEQNDPDIPGLLGASLALGLSDIPWSGPVAGVRIGRNKDGEKLLNPTTAERLEAQLDVVVSGTADRPRLVVFRSLKNIYAQVIDDVAHKTLIAAGTDSKEIKGQVKGKKTDLAEAVGKLVAGKAMSAGITKVAFDRGGFKYHGRVKAVAEGARKAGLTI